MGQKKDVVIHRSGLALAVNEAMAACVLSCLALVCEMTFIWALFPYLRLGTKSNSGIVG